MRHVWTIYHNRAVIGVCATQDECERVLITVKSISAEIAAKTYAMYVDLMAVRYDSVSGWVWSHILERESVARNGIQPTTTNGSFNHPYEFAGYMCKYSDTENQMPNGSVEKRGK